MGNFGVVKFPDGEGGSEVVGNGERESGAFLRVEPLEIGLFWTGFERVRGWIMEHNCVILSMRKTTHSDRRK